MSDAERIERLRAALLNGEPVTHGDIHWLAGTALESVKLRAEYERLGDERPA